MSDGSLTVCPKELCGQKKWGRGKVKKLIGAGAGLIFKGSGFYITDYRSENYKAGVKKESGTKDAATPAATPAVSTESKTAPAADKKPAAKVESKPAKGVK